MPVDIGSRIGAYEVLALIGQGGMGRVYRARDTRLKRDVAIKALQPEIIADADRIARFRREAETLAAVNHPHIASIHDVLDWEGSQLLVLELVEGETLAERIQRGAIPVREALVIAQQMATALEAAHSAGIVHRDLKPANVKITPEGVVKVLDFGLAKGQARDTPHAASLTHSPTNIASATAGGVILGTASYMSPEQARGQIVDTQSDVWSFGCLLFEMLTGRRAFEGPTVTDVLAAVVRGEANWSRLPQNTPVALRALLGRCLQKERGRRLHHIADARIEIDDVLSDRSPVVEPPTTSAQTRRRWAWVAAGILLVFAAGLAVGLALAVRPVPPPPEMRVEITTPPSPEPVFVAMSPDGQTLAFVAATDGLARLWLRSLKENVARPLAGTELATSPFWAPDSRSLGFFADGKLKRIDLDGGVVRVLASAPVGYGGTWNRDGVIVYSPSAISQLVRVSASGGEDPVAVTRLATGQTGHRYPHFLPDHRHFFFYARGTPGLRGIYIASLDSAESRHVLDADSTGMLASTGDLLFVRQRTLFAQRFRADRLEVAGEPFAITSQIAFDAGNNAAALTTSPAGPLAYRTGGASGERHLTWFDRSGKKLGVIGAADTTSLFNVELSPDGQSIALNRTVDEYQDVWLLEAARGVFRRFTFDPLSDQIPVWTPDGQRVVFGSNRRQGAYDLYMKAANGPDTEVRLLESAQNKFPMGFSADGRFLLYRNTGANTNWDLWALPFGPDGKPGTPFPVVQSSFQELMGELSPDGRWVAYQSNESGKYEVYVQSFPQAGARMQVSTNGGSQPHWRRDAQELFYVGLDARLMAAPLTTGAGEPFQAGVAAGLFVTRLPGGPVPVPQKHQYAVSADGQRFLMNNLTDEASTQPITLIVNWSSPVR